MTDIAHPELDGLGRYAFGWSDSDSAGATARRGLNEDVVRNISALKSEPDDAKDFAMRDKSITDHMGCDVVWNPAYTSTMVRNGLQSWNLDDIVLWQYCGDGKATFPKLPHNVPGFGHGKVDISVYIQGAEKPDLETLRDRLID